jgi:hypothetical protein
VGNGHEVVFILALNPEDEVTVDQIGNHLPVTNQQVEPLNISVRQLAAL